MANDYNVNQTANVNGLGTFSSTIAVAGPYTVNVNSTIPGSVDSEGTQQSNLQIQIKQNNTVLVTVGGSTQNPTPSQGSIGCGYSFQAAANDVVHVVFSSSNAIDSVPNKVKSQINLFQSI